MTGRSDRTDPAPLARLGHGAKMLAATAGLAAIFLAGCAADAGGFEIENVLDEICACDMVEFANGLGGEALSDWRRNGGDGVRMARTEGGADAAYSVTRETDSSGSLCRLVFTKTIRVTQIPDKTLNIYVSEGYNARLKNAATQYVTYYVTESADSSSEETGSVSHVQISQEEAAQLLDASGFSQLPSELETSPIEFFADAFMEHHDSSYTSDRWGDFNDFRK